MRRSLDILAVLSALLCLAGAGMWVRSYWVDDTYRRPDAPRDPATATTTLISSNSGSVVVGRYEVVYLGPDRIARAQGMRQFRRGWLSESATPVPVLGTLLPRATKFTLDETTRRRESFITVLPYWLIVLCLMVLPGWRVARFVRRRRPPGACRSCGYDLRGSQESGRCPECGQTFAASQ